MYVYTKYDKVLTLYTLICCNAWSLILSLCMYACWILLSNQVLKFKVEWLKVIMDVAVGC